MALVLADRVQQTGTANTTVSFTLSGSVTGFQSFSVVGNGNTTYYSATDASGNWEVGIGTYATGGTLTRTTILSSSNSGSAVTFSGTVAVLLTYPSGKSVNLDASGNATALGTPAAFVGTNITGTASGLSIGGNAATATNVPYSGLTGAVPTWNQNTTGNAATATNVPYSGLTGAVPTWNQNTTGNAATCGGLTPTSASGTANRIVASDGNGYIFNNYFNSTDNSIGSGVTAIMAKQGDNYYRSATAGAVATFISGQSMNIAGNAATVSSITGNTGLMTDRLTPTSLIDGLTTSNFRSTFFGTTTNAAAIATTRWNNVPAPFSGLGLYGTSLGWAASDTQGFIATNYASAGVIIGGGAGNSILWSNAAPLYNANWYSGSLYASTLYDTNNTAYYLDPASTSVLNQINPASIYFTTANPTFNASSYFVASGGAYFNSGTVYCEAAIQARGGISNDSGAALTLNGGTSGYTNINGSARSPIFYDSNDTSYYCDPNANSSLLTANVSLSRFGSSGNANTDFQNTPAGTTRIQGDDANLAGGPGNVWWFYQNMRHSNGSNYWGTQVAWGWEDNANRLATRNVSANSFGGWVYYINSANIGSQSVSSAGNGVSGFTDYENVGFRYLRITLSNGTNLDVMLGPI